MSQHLCDVCGKSFEVDDAGGENFTVGKRTICGPECLDKHNRVTVNLPKRALVLIDGDFYHLREGHLMVLDGFQQDQVVWDLTMKGKRVDLGETP